jgi:hypothetical protein
LLKTIWNGLGGRLDRQLADGNITKHIAAERKLNDALVEEHNRPPPF